MTQARNFGFGPDEQMLRDTVRQFLADNFGIEKLRRLVARDHREAYESAVPPAPWTRGCGGKWSSSAGAPWRSRRRPAVPA